MPTLRPSVSTHACLLALAAVGLGTAVTLPSAHAEVGTIVNDSQSSVGTASLAWAGTWTARTGTAQYGGDDRYSRTPGASYVLRFTGTSAVLHGATTTNHGQGTVEVDGRVVTTIDQYASAPRYDVPVFSTGTLPYGQHTVKVTVTGTKAPASTSTYLSFDRALVGGATATPPPTTAPAPVAPSPSATPSPTTAPTAPAAPTSGKRYLVVDEAALKALPTSGTAWSNLLRTADGSLGTVDLANQDNTHAARTLAAALVYARTGNASYRDKVVGQLARLPGASLATARTLSVGRQLAGYAIAADLVGYRDPSFVSFMSAIRTKHIGNHGRWVTLTQTSEDTANNWGTWALSSRVAASLYVGDTVDVQRATKVFRGFLGDRSAYADFRPTGDWDTTWICGSPTAWVPINPAGCGDRDGAAVEDIARSAGSYPAYDETGLKYTWEVLGGITLTAKLLSQAGSPDVYGWSDRAILRAADFLSRKGGFPASYSVTQHTTWMINKAYGTKYPTNPAGFGRQYGFTDWLP